jgi:hypothetical protein
MSVQIYETPAEERAVKRFLAAKIRESMNRIEKHPPHGHQILCLREALGSIAPTYRFRLSPTPTICLGIRSPLRMLLHLLGLRDRRANQ